MTRQSSRRVTDTTPDGRIAALAAMPEWEFILVAHEGLLSEPHAGTTYKGTCYSEGEIHSAWFARNPGSEPLI